MTLQLRLDYQRGLTAQSPDAEWIVIYTASGTDASAVLVDRSALDLPFIADHKTYFCEVGSREEGNYLAGFLNSRYANDRIKGFQSTGLFGERDVHKTIVMLPLPAFDRSSDDHIAIARLAGKCASRAASHAASVGWRVLTPHPLGRARTEMRRLLADPMSEIDDIFARAIGGARPARRTRGRSSSPGPLFGDR